MKILSFFTLSPDYYELPKKSVRANGFIYFLFKPNKYRDEQILYRDKASLHMTLKKFQILTSALWKKNINTSLLIC